MAILSKKDYEDIYREEEYNPKGLGRLVCAITTVIVVCALLFFIARCSGSGRADGQRNEITNQNK